MTPCNPLRSGLLQRSALWDSTFGSDGAVGCLRVAWGASSEPSDEGARTALVRLSPEVVLRGFNPQENRFDAPLRLTWTDIKFDSQGNLYLLCSFSGRVRALSTPLTSRGGTDICLVKRSNAGQVVRSRQNRYLHLEDGAQRPWSLRHHRALTCRS